MIRSRLASLIGSLSDLFWPPSCAICKALITHPDPPVCPACQEAFEPLEGPVCDRCGQPGGFPGHCADCQGEDPAPSRIRSAGPFDGILQDAILRLKLDGKTGLAPYLASWIAGANLDLDLAGQDFLVGVPLHRRRLAQRGFNQSVLIGKALSRIIDVPLDRYHLVRHRDTPSQFKMQDRRAREKNVAEAFRVKAPHPFRNHRICLIDDVITTGATLRACADALSEAGAREVVAVTVARTVLW